MSSLNYMTAYSEMTPSCKNDFGNSKNSWRMSYGMRLNFFSYTCTQVITYDLNKWHHGVPPVFK